MPPPARQLRDRRAKPRSAPGVFSAEASLPWHAALQRHWPEYLIEAVLIAVFVALTGTAMALLGAAASPLHVADPLRRRALIGLVMGLSTALLVYSPWGRRSGAHMNPAVTLAFYRLRKVGRSDLLFYLLAQFAGAIAGILLARAALGTLLTAAPVSWAVTVPAAGGAAVAFAAELALAAAWMLTLLYTANHPQLQRWTGVFAGALIAVFFTFESALAGFGMNPARSFASALASGTWTAQWLYLLAPVLGMLLAVEAYRALSGRQDVLCAKLAHNVRGRCIFACQHPDQARANALEALDRDMFAHSV